MDKITKEKLIESFADNNIYFGDDTLDKLLIAINDLLEHFDKKTKP